MPQDDWPHDIDPHSSQAAGEDELASLDPGDEYGVGNGRPRGAERDGEGGELCHEDLLRPIEILHPRKALTFSPTTPVSAVLAEMHAQQEGCVLIVDGDDVVGIFTERDVLLRLHGGGHLSRLDEMEIREVMTPDPEMLLSTDNLAYALNRMAIGGFRHIPILEPVPQGDEGPPRPPSILSVRYLTTYLADFFPDIVYNIPPQPHREGIARFGA